MKTRRRRPGRADTRHPIDRIDLQIVQALGRRMDYVTAASRFKASEPAIPAPERVAAMHPERARWAEVNGL
ncbi:chorismate mutase family protein, partial [Pseudomonas aeruginosa]|uniref:chorismate mutase family protein n=1 Tax=Pseudomonas aeruginosa TaxID=287 RepID=UPI003CC67CD0